MPENTYYNPRNDEVIASSREAAIVRLNTYPIEVGKTVYIKYYADLNKTCIDALVAIGITNGTGPGTYSIISDKGIALVTKIVLELPDVTELVHGQLYLYHDPATNLNYYVYLKTMTRIITLVKESVMLVTAETGKLWWVETNLLKDLTNFYTKEEIDAMDFNKNTYNYNYNIKKTYESVSLMQSDSSSPVGTDGTAIQIGDIVTVVNSTTPSENGIYSYEGATDGWKYQSSFNFQLVQNTGTDVNSAMSQDAVTTELDSLRSDLEEELIDITDIPVLGVKANYSVNATTGGYVYSNLNNAYEFDVINLRGEKIHYTREVRPTDGNNGIAFFGSDGAYISGEKTKTNPSVSSSENAFEISEVLIPSNASTMRVAFYANKEDALRCFFASSRLDKLDDVIAELNQTIKDIASKVESLRFEISSLPILYNRSLPNLNTSVRGMPVEFKGVGSEKNTFVLDVEGLRTFSYPLFKSTSGLGSCFADENGNFISGYSNSTEDEGTLREVVVPEGAKYFYYGGTSEGYIISDSELQNINKNLVSVKLEVADISGTIKDVSFLESAKKGYYDILVPIGTEIDVSDIKSSSVTSSIYIECKAGETYLLSGYGGASSRLWAVLDAEKKLVASAVANLVIEEPIAIQIEQNGYIIYQSLLGTVTDRFSRIGEISKIRTEVKSLVPEKTNPFAEAMFGNGLVLACERRVIDNNKPVFYSGYLFYKWNQVNKLYYGSNLNEAYYVADVPFDVSTMMMAMSPKDGRVIAAKRGNRNGIYVFDGERTSFLAFDSLSQKPMGWLYNSGVEFDIDENGTEICLFAEYTASPSASGGYHVWRGTYPYNSESLWEDVLFVPYAGDNPTLGITHLHQIRRDPWTGILYLTSGDDSAYSRWWYSKDHGKTWIKLTDGVESGWEANICRCINFVFTKDKAYFATDYRVNHCLNSIERGEDGVLDISTRNKVVDLPNNQSTNSICYCESPNGIFFYDRWDTLGDKEVNVLFYSFGDNELVEVAKIQLLENYTQLPFGGHRGDCYLNYTNGMNPYPAMGFCSHSPCVFELNYPNVSGIGTIYYNIVAKNVMIK